jgi:hypothetical protein
MHAMMTPSNYTHHQPLLVTCVKRLKIVEGDPCLFLAPSLLESLVGHRRARSEVHDEVDLRRLVLYEPVIPSDIHLMLERVQHGRVATKQRGRAAAEVAGGGGSTACRVGDFDVEVGL